MFNVIAKNIEDVLNHYINDVEIKNISDVEDLMNLPLPSILVEWTGYSVAQDEAFGNLTRANVNFAIHVSSKSAIGNGINDDAMHSCLSLLYRAITCLVGHDVGKGNHVHLADCSKSIMEGNGFYSVQANIFVNTSLPSIKEKTWKNMRT